MQVNIKKGHEDYTLQMPVQVILGDNKIPVLLGREGLFNEFQIIFDQLNKRVSLKKLTSMKY